jgi:hypothetical protein
VAYYRRDRLDDASASFRAAIERAGMVAPAAYNLGRIAAERGESERAQDWFALAVEKAETESVRARARRRLSPDRADPAVTGSLSAGMGYDTNVATVPEDLPNVSTEADAFAEASAYGRHALGEHAHLAARLYVQRFADETDFDITSVRAGGGREWSLGDERRIQTSAHVRTLRVGGDAFEDRLTGSADYERPMGDTVRGRITAEASWRRGRDAFDFLDGTGFALEGHLEPSDNDGQWSLGVTYSRVDRDDLARPDAFRSFSWHALAVAAEWDWHLGAGLRLGVDADWRTRHYDDPERRNGRRLGHRDAQRLRLGAGLRGDGPGAWDWYSRVTLERRDADLERFDYTREAAEAGLTYRY